MRGGAGLFFDRVPLRALANALLSAGNTTDVANLRQVERQPVAGAGRRAGVPRTSSPRRSPRSTLPSLTTMDRDMQNAYSRQASIEVERQLGERSTVSVGYQYIARASTCSCPSIRTCRRARPSGTNNGCRPNPAYANNSQYSPAARRSITACTSRSCSARRSWGLYRVSYTLSKAMDNVGEFFFSSPIDPFDLSKDWGRSDDDQRHRLVVNGTRQTSLGFQLSGMLQAYSALPFNITSGVTTIQGTAGRPIVDGAFIPRNAGVGARLLQPEPASEPLVPDRRRRAARSAASKRSTSRTA